MGDASRGVIHYKEEVSFGAEPGGNYVLARYTNETLDMSIETIASAETTPERQVKETLKTNVQAAGDINGELSVDGHNDMLEAVLMSADRTAGAIHTNQSFTVSASSKAYTDTVGTNNRFATTLIGDVVVFSGFANVANNGPKLVVGKLPGDDSIVVADGSLVDVSPAETDISLQLPAAVRLGSTLRSFHIQKSLPIAAGAFEYEMFTGMVPNILRINAAVGQAVTVGFSFLGKAATISGTTGAGGTPTNPGGGAIFAHPDAIEAIEIGDPLVPVQNVQSLSITLNNNARVLQALGQLGPIEVGLGQAVVEGTMRAYFLNRSEVEDFIGFTASRMMFSLVDAATQRLAFSIPNLKFTKATTVLEGNNTDLVVDLAFQGYLSTFAHSFSIHQFI